MKKIVLIIIAVLACKAYGQPLQVNPERAVFLRGIIYQNMTSVKTNIELMAQVAAAPIFLLIDSEGGSTSAASLIAGAIRYANLRGSSVICIVYGKAFSSAYWLLSSCNSVYVLKGSQLLFHPIQILVTGFHTLYHFNLFVKRSREFNKYWLLSQVYFTNMDIDMFVHHLVSEKVWDAEELKKAAPSTKFTILERDKVEGLDIPSWTMYQKVLWKPYTEEQVEFWKTLLREE